MQQDPAIYIIAAAVIGAAIGFFGCALLASHEIRGARQRGFQDGQCAANRSRREYITRD